MGDVQLGQGWVLHQEGSSICVLERMLRNQEKVEES